MGILTNVKDKVKNSLITAADKGANLIAKASSLSSEQLQNIEERRHKFMSEKPDTDPEGIKRLLGSYAIEAFEAYLPQISSLYNTIPLEKGDDSLSISNRIRYFEITKWVTDPSEESLEKLINVYQVIDTEDCNIALIYNRKVNGCHVYLAVVNNGASSDPTQANSLIKMLSKALKGNFPGSITKAGDKNIDDWGSGYVTCLKNLDNFSVAAVSNIASKKNDDFLNQCMEKLLDGICPKNPNEEYTIVLLATPVKEQLERKNQLSDLYSKLAPYASWQTNFTYTETDTENSSASFGVSLGASAGKQTGDAVTNGMSSSSTDSKTNAVSKGTSSNVTKTKSAGANVGADGVIFKAGLNAGVSKAISKGTSYNESLANTHADTIGKMSSATQNTGFNLGFNFGVNFARSSNVSVAIGKNEGLTQSFTNYSIKYTLETIEKQIKRLEESLALGMWDFAAYFLSRDQIIANNAAHMYFALTQGNESYLSQPAINLWEAGDKDKKEDVNNILEFIKRLQHPQFQLKNNLGDGYTDNEWLMYPPHIDATVSLTGRELSRSMNLPKRSVKGLPVIECASFGREVHKYELDEQDEKHIELGKTYHMHQEEDETVLLDVDSLASHTFITGSTGSGKSNTVYQIITKALDKDVKFMAIEPTKGEYKDVFSGNEKVHMYGTNPKKMPLLKLNPFSFPDDIHVLEHTDRLVEIFNVCWPMYAAMPAVLKSAVEKSYEDCGWNLIESNNEFGENLYPNFADVARNIRQIIDSSEYDTENKGAYKGSLLTRLNSLTNGINGLIFTNEEILPKELFDENVIVDLSCVGSSETKSLLMGMLVLKLQEYRMSHGGTNKKLEHLTVLEEAHNLLKRTSTDQSAESGNLIGKSVEMIANAIAEMRTYGEGFIVADQAPGLLDMSVIRNTNTKIIMRLPDQSDRELVGKSAHLNDNQIDEIARFPKGVAAVYQNNWIEPVLCKMDRLKYEENSYKYEKPVMKTIKDNSDKALKIAELLSRGAALSREKALTEINPIMQELKLDSSIRTAIFIMLQNPPQSPRMTKLAPIMSALFPNVSKAAEKAYSESYKPNEWTSACETALRSSLQTTIQDNVRRDIIQAILTEHIYNKMGNKDDLERWSQEVKLL